jgi:predicted DNA-binding protein
MARNAQLNLRVRPTLKAKLEKLAKEVRRTLSAYVEKLLEDHVKDFFPARGRTQERGQPKKRDALIA